LLRQRDRRVEIFIEDFNCCNTRYLKYLFFRECSLRRCQQRLSKLVEYKRLKRVRDFVSQDYLYYVDKKPEQIEHDLVRVEFYIWMQERLVDFIPNYKIGKLIADAYYELCTSENSNGTKDNEENGEGDYFLEVQLSNGFNQFKYEEFYNSGEWRSRWEVFPKVVVVSNRWINIKKGNVEFEVLGVNEIREKVKGLLLGSEGRG
jgi:hypothetical protein